MDDAEWTQMPKCSRDPHRTTSRRTGFYFYFTSPWRNLEIRLRACLYEYLSEARRCGVIFCLIVRNRLEIAG
jgi:hypothetical protein